MKIEKKSVLRTDKRPKIFREHYRVDLSLHMGIHQHQHCILVN